MNKKTMASASAVGNTQFKRHRVITKGKGVVDDNKQPMEKRHKSAEGATHTLHVRS